MGPRARTHARTHTKTYSSTYELGVVFFNRSVRAERGSTKPRVARDSQSRCLQQQGVWKTVKGEVDSFTVSPPAASAVTTQ